MKHPHPKLLPELWHFCHLEFWVEVCRPTLEAWWLRHTDNFTLMPLLVCTSLEVSKTHVAADMIVSNKKDRLGLLTALVLWTHKYGKHIEHSLFTKTIAFWTFLNKLENIPLMQWSVRCIFCKQWLIDISKDKPQMLGVPCITFHCDSSDVWKQAIEIFHIVYKCTNEKRYIGLTVLYGILCK